jgi:RimJ/RimL family protein N-acetyltransferase
MSTPPKPTISKLVDGTLTDEERVLPTDPSGCYEKYGIKFHELRREHLEELRRWRNHPDIQRFMVFQDEITAAMQKSWFDSLHELECYTMLEFRGQIVGMTQLKKIDYPYRRAEGGIIIFRPEHQSGLIPYRAAIGGLDSDFLHRGLESVYATIRKTNSRARRFAKSLGYVFSDPDPDGDLLSATVHIDAYFREAKKWRAVLNNDAAEGFGLSTTDLP